MARQRVTTHTTAQFGTVHTRHHPVGDDDAHFLLGQDIERLYPIVSRKDIILLLEVAFQEMDHVFRIINDEDGDVMASRNGGARCVMSNWSHHV